MSSTRKDQTAGSVYGGDIRGLGGKAAQVYDELLRRLIYGKYRFGTLIPTVDLLAEFRLSRAPLTAALNQLRFEGYIDITPQVGSRVIDPTRQQISDYYVMFALVEQQIARFAAERRTAQQAAAIARFCDQLTQNTAGLDRPTEGFVDMIDMYHMAIRQAAHSPHEVRRVSGYFRFAAFLVMNGWPRNFVRMLEVSNRDRPKVTAAIVAGDVEAAGIAMYAYITGGVGS